MTDPSWIDLMHTAICMVLFLAKYSYFLENKTKQPVLIPTLQVNKKEGKPVTASMQVIYTWAHQTTQLTALPVKQSPFVLTQMKTGIIMRENYFCMYLAVKS